MNAKAYTAIYDSSPLVVVGVHRLLTAILQDALNPKENDDLEQFWKNGFPAKKIEDFGNKYADRFDLFSTDKPFLQSADLPMFPRTKEEVKQTKYVAKLFPDAPSGDEVLHYRHKIEDDVILSSASAAFGLLMIPAFMSSGGRGFLPSINDAPPPIYVIPGGKSLFEVLCASLISETQLDDQLVKNDLAWWRRDVFVVEESKKKKKINGKMMNFNEHKQLSTVGYLHGLTFPSRKIRLHPEKINSICSRSGVTSEWCVRKMTFRMGESLVDDDGNWWRDPFVAYRLPDQNGEKPKTIKANRDKAIWREFNSLFLWRDDNSRQAPRPRFIDQLSVLSIGKEKSIFPFHCIALVAQANAKKFDWFDFGFDIPPSLLQDFEGSVLVEKALSFASECCDPQKGKKTKGIRVVFSIEFGKATKNFERFQRLKNRMTSDYWAVLANHFRKFVIEIGDHSQWEQSLDTWRKTVVREAQNAFDQAADATGDDGAKLHQIVEGKSRCYHELMKIRNQYQQKGG